MQSVFNSGQHGVVISLSGLEVTINGNVYKDPMCIARLLTIEELERLERFDVSTHSSSALLDEEIINNTFECFLGIADEVDWESIDAGIISTIANAIKLKSIQLASDLLGTIAAIQQNLNVYHSIQAIVSRFLATSFSEVEKLPINELIRRYTICLQAFPQEVKPPTENEQE